MLWHLRVSSQLKGTFTKPEVLVEPLTFITVHWNVRTAKSYSTSVCFRLNLGTNDSGSLPELFWHGGWWNVPNQCCLWFEGFGVLLLIVWLTSSRDCWPLDGCRSPKAQHFKEFMDRIVSSSSLFQRDLRARLVALITITFYFYFFFSIGFVLFQTVNWSYWPCAVSQCRAMAVLASWGNWAAHTNLTVQTCILSSFSLLQLLQLSKWF